MREVEDHYTHGGLLAAIDAALAAAGLDPNRVSAGNLAPIDEFHVRGRDATRELAAAAGIGADTRVLDVGCGLGGPSRRLALEYGCDVTGIDLTAEYCAVAAVLAERLGLADRVRYRTANALELPFDDGEFDVAWTQHAAMNIADKPRLYAEMFRVARSGGRLAIYDIARGESGEVLFPVPWARDPSTSFLCSASELRQLVEDAGFAIESFTDTTAAGRDWFRRVRARMGASSASPLGFQVLLGEDFRDMAANQVRNLEEDRIALVQLVARRPG